MNTRLPARLFAFLAGWIRFDYKKAFGCPVRIVNDAAMQAMGSYQGGRMLFLGLGTGLGSALVANDVLEPLELAHLPYRNNKTYEDYVGLPDDGRRYELIDGTLIVSPGPVLPHQDMVGNLHLLLRAGCPAELDCSRRASRRTGWSIPRPLR